MRKEVVRPDGDLKREVWVFSLVVGLSSPCIYFDHYAIETRTAPRHKWRTQDHWTRLELRYSTIAIPPLPEGVKMEMLKHYQESILTLLIKT